MSEVQEALLQNKVEKDVVRFHCQSIRLNVKIFGEATTRFNLLNFPADDYMRLAKYLLFFQFLCYPCLALKAQQVDVTEIVSRLEGTGAVVELDDTKQPISVYWDPPTGKFTDKDLSSASKLKTLKELWLVNADISDRGLESLQSLKGLVRLALICKYQPNTPSGISVAGIAHLKCLTELKVLRLDNSDLTDSGIKSLKELAKLEELDLFGTEISDKGLIELSNLPRMMYLNVRETQWETQKGAITAEGVRAFKKKKPNCVVDY